MGVNLIQQYVDSLQATQPNKNSDTHNNYPVNLTGMKNDSIAFLDMYAVLKENEELSNEAQGVQEGKINNENAFVKIVPRVLPNGMKLLYKEGYIGDKTFQLKSEAKIDPDKKSYHYTGRYGDKDIDLIIDIPREKNRVKRFFNETVRNRLYVPDNIDIKGSFGDKSYELSLPDAKVPRDTDEKNLITLLLNTHSFQVGVVDGEIVSVEPGDARIQGWERKIEKRQEFFKENVKPLISQTLSTALGAVLAVVIGRIGLKH